MVDKEIKALEIDLIDVRFGNFHLLSFFNTLECDIVQLFAVHILDTNVLLVLYMLSLFD